MAKMNVRQGGRRLMLLGIAALVVLGYLGGSVVAPRAVHGQPAGGVFVGRVSDSEAFIAIVSDGQRVTVYICDGLDGGVPSLWGWFSAPLSEGTTRIENDRGHLVSLDRAESGVTGQVTLQDGVTRNFSAEPATGDAGVYRAELTTASQSLLAGIIVLNSGEQRGAIVDRLTNGIMPSPMLNIVNPVLNLAGSSITAVKLTAPIMPSPMG